MTKLEEITFHISGTAMSVIDGSELSSDAVKYDGGSKGAHDALAALTDSTCVRRGRGHSYIVSATRDGADTIRDYCRTVGETFAFETETETRRDGAALLKVATKLDELLS